MVRCCISCKRHLQNVRLHTHELLMLLMQVFQENHNRDITFIIFELLPQSHPDKTGMDELRAAMFLDILLF